MTASLVDTHCHIGHITDAPEATVAAAVEAGVVAIVDIGMGTEESRSVVARAEASGGRVWASVGIHPNDLREFEADPDATMAELRRLASRPSVVGIGETGLDFYRDRESPETQEAAFRAHIALAKELDRTLVIHCRDAHAEVVRVLDDAGAPERVVMHCFSGDAAFARVCAERTYFCSFAGNVTYPRNDVLREAARMLPGDLILTETDAPYLAPVPHRGKPNSPALMPLTAAAVAEACGMTAAELSEALEGNVRRAFPGLNPQVSAL